MSAPLLLSPVPKGTSLFGTSPSDGATRGTPSRLTGASGRHTGQGASYVPQFDHQAGRPDSDVLTAAPHATPVGAGAHTYKKQKERSDNARSVLQGMSWRFLTEGTLDDRDCLPTPALTRDGLQYAQQVERERREEAEQLQQQQQQQDAERGLTTPPPGNRQRATALTDWVASPDQTPVQGEYYTSPLPLSPLSPLRAKHAVSPNVAAPRPSLPPSYIYSAARKEVASPAPAATRKSPQPAAAAAAVFNANTPLKRRQAQARRNATKDLLQKLYPVDPRLYPDHLRQHLRNPLPPLPPKILIEQLNITNEFQTRKPTVSVADHDIDDEDELESGGGAGTLERPARSHMSQSYSSLEAEIIAMAARSIAESKALPLPCPTPAKTKGGQKGRLHARDSKQGRARLAAREQKAEAARRAAAAGMEEEKQDDQQHAASPVDEPASGEDGSSWDEDEHDDEEAEGDEGGHHDGHGADEGDLAAAAAQDARRRLADARAFHDRLRNSHSSDDVDATAASAMNSILDHDSHLSAPHPIPPSSSSALSHDDILWRSSRRVTEALDVPPSLAHALLREPTEAERMSFMARLNREELEAERAEEARVRAQRERDRADEEREATGKDAEALLKQFEQLKSSKRNNNNNNNHSAREEGTGTIDEEGEEEYEGERSEAEQEEEDEEMAPALSPLIPDFVPSRRPSASTMPKRREASPPQQHQHHHPHHHVWPPSSSAATAAAIEEEAVRSALNGRDPSDIDAAASTSTTTTSAIPPSAYADPSDRFQHDHARLLGQARSIREAPASLEFESLAASRAAARARRAEEEEAQRVRRNQVAQATSAALEGDGEGGGDGEDERAGARMALKRAAASAMASAAVARAELNLKPYGSSSASSVTSAAEKRRRALLASRPEFRFEIFPGTLSTAAQIEAERENSFAGLGGGGGTASHPAHHSLTQSASSPSLLQGGASAASASMNQSLSLSKAEQDQLDRRAAAYALRRSQSPSPSNPLPAFRPVHSRPQGFDPSTQSSFLPRPRVAKEKKRVGAWYLPVRQWKAEVLPPHNDTQSLAESVEEEAAASRARRARIEASGGGKGHATSSTFNSEGGEQQSMAEKARWLQDAIPTLFISSVYKAHLEQQQQQQQQQVAQQQQQQQHQPPASAEPTAIATVPTANPAAPPPPPTRGHHRLSSFSTHSLLQQVTATTGGPTLASSASTGSLHPASLVPTHSATSSSLPPPSSTPSHSSVPLRSSPPVRMPPYLAPLIPLDPSHPETVIVDFAPGTNSIEAVLATAAVTGGTATAGGDSKGKRQQGRSNARTSAASIATTGVVRPVSADGLFLQSSGSSTSVNPNVALLQARAAALADSAAEKMPAGSSPSRLHAATASQQQRERETLKHPHPHPQRRDASVSPTRDAGRRQQQQQRKDGRRGQGSVDMSSTFSSSMLMSSVAAPSSSSASSGGGGGVGADSTVTTSEGDIDAPPLSPEEVEEAALVASMASEAQHRKAGDGGAKAGPRHRSTASTGGGLRTTRRKGVDGAAHGVAGTHHAGHHGGVEHIPGLASSHHSHVFLPNIAVTAHAPNHNAERAAANVALLTRLHEQAQEIDARAAKEKEKQATAAAFQAHVAGQQSTPATASTAAVSVLPSALDGRNGGGVLGVHIPVPGMLIVDHREFAPDDQEYAHPLEVGMRREPRLMHFQRHRQSMAAMQQMGKGSTRGQGLLTPEQLYAIELERMKRDDGDEEEEGEGEVAPRDHSDDEEDEEAEDAEEREDCVRSLQPSSSASSTPSTRRGGPRGSPSSAESASARPPFSNLSVGLGSDGDADYLRASVRGPFSPNTHDYAETPHTPGITMQLQQPRGFAYGSR